MPYRVFLEPRAESCRGPNGISPLTEFEAASVCLELASLSASSLLFQPTLPAPSALNLEISFQRSPTTEQHATAHLPRATARLCCLFRHQGNCTCLVAGPSFSCRERHRPPICVPILLPPLLLPITCSIKASLRAHYRQPHIEPSSTTAYNNPSLASTADGNRYSIVASLRGCYRPVSTP